MLVACDAWEYGKEGIKVFAYCPGYVATDLAGMREKKLEQGAPGAEGSARGVLDISEVSDFLRNFCSLCISRWFVECVSGRFWNMFYESFSCAGRVLLTKRFCDRGRGMRTLGSSCIIRAEEGCILGRTSSTRNNSQ